MIKLYSKINCGLGPFGLGGHFRKNQYWFSAVSLIFIEPGTSWRVDFSPPRSDISRYAPVFFPLRIDDFNCFLLRNPMNFNCFFRHFNCVNTQIRSLTRVLHFSIDFSSTKPAQVIGNADLWYHLSRHNQNTQHISCNVERSQ